MSFSLLEHIWNIVLRPFAERATLPTDTHDERRRKYIMLPVFFLEIMMCAQFAVTQELNLLNFALLFFLVNGTWGIVMILVFRKLSQCQAEVSVVFTIIALFCADLYWASLGHRLLPQLIITVNFLVVCGRRGFTCDIAVVLITVWLCVTGIEDVLRFGLYDLPGTAGTNDRNEVFICSGDYPCKRTVGFTTVSVSMFWVLFMYGYYFTRIYTAQAEKDTILIHASIQAAKKIAVSLSEFNLDEAEATLTGEEDLPSELRECFYMILGSLRGYRPYLPQSCLLLKTIHDNSCDEEDITTTATVSAMARTPSTTKRTITSNVALSLRSVGSLSTNPLVQSNRSIVDLKKKTVSVIVTNLRGTLESLEDSFVVFSRVHSNMTSNAMSIFIKYKGILETFIGDSLTASFNAIKACVNHKTAAVQSALLLKESMKDNLIHIGVTTGVASCGDLGCEGMRRFSTIGRVAAWGHTLQRIGREINKPILCDNSVKLDVCMMFQVKVILQMVVYPKRGSTAPAFLWEIIPTDTPDSGGEWLYDLPSNPTLEQFNEAAVEYLLERPHRCRSIASKNPTNPLLNELLEIMAANGAPVHLDISGFWGVLPHIAEVG
eukprot:TRINITY_DN11197_c2_g1_i1.p1 TRINITY_DN11197_c2_g1~~TRINITY_DN11197_c2_g1_i1.p1  ORF type:complete len:613 (+),score=71.74 TRINITY_DN11197_c2_g1_i1:27-1841(+)